MKLRLPRWKAGEWPKASELNQFSELLERLSNIVVDGSTGLQFEDAVTGPKFSFIPQTLMVRYATITTACPGFGSTAAGGTNKYGMGAGILDTETYDPTTRKATRVAGTEIVDIHNGGVESIPAGRRVLVIELAPKRYHTAVNFCPT